MDTTYMAYNIEWDIEKPVLIQASGPSARKITKGDGFYTCSINLSGRLISHIDFLVINDANFIPELDGRELSKIDNLCIPEYPHSVIPNKFHPNIRFRYDSLTSHIDKAGVNIHTFNIHTVDKYVKVYDKSLPIFNVISSGESAVCMMNHLGFKKIIITGFDPQGGRNPLIPGKRAGRNSVLTYDCDPPDRYKRALERVLKCGREMELKIIKLETNSDTVIDDSIINKLEWDSFKSYKKIDTTKW